MSYFVDRMGRICLDRRQSFRTVPKERRVLSAKPVLFDPAFQFDHLRDAWLHTLQERRSTTLTIVRTQVLLALIASSYVVLLVSGLQGSVNWGFLSLPLTESALRALSSVVPFAILMVTAYGLRAQGRKFGVSRDAKMLEKEMRRYSGFVFDDLKSTFRASCDSVDLSACKRLDFVRSAAKNFWLIIVSIVTLGAFGLSVYLGLRGFYHDDNSTFGWLIAYVVFLSATLFITIWLFIEVTWRYRKREGKTGKFWEHFDKARDAFHSP